MSKAGIMALITQGLGSLFNEDNFEHKGRDILNRHYIWVDIEKFFYLYICENNLTNTLQNLKDDASFMSTSSQKCDQHIEWVSDKDNTVHLIYD